MDKARVWNDVGCRSSPDSQSAGHRKHSDNLELYWYYPTLLPASPLIEDDKLGHVAHLINCIVGDYGTAAGSQVSYMASLFSADQRLHIKQPESVLSQLLIGHTTRSADRA